MYCYLLLNVMLTEYWILELITDNWNLELNIFLYWYNCFYFSIYLSTAILCNFLSDQLLNVNFLVTVIRMNDGLALRRWNWYLVSGKVIWYLVSGWYLVSSVVNTNWPVWAISLFGGSKKSGAFWMRLCSSDIDGSGRWINLRVDL